MTGARTLSEPELTHLAQSLVHTLIRNPEAIDQARHSARLLRALGSGAHHESVVQETLWSLACRLACHQVLIHRKKDGWLMVALYGNARYLTWREALVWRLFNRPPAGFFCEQTTRRVHPLAQPEGQLLARF